MRIQRDVLFRLSAKRGLDPLSVEACVTGDLGGGWIQVDPTHPSYPARVRHQSAVHPDAQLAPPEQGRKDGPGTQLKGLLRLLGITASSACSCNARAAQMDEWGPDECEKRIPEIVGWLEQQARSRKLPFVRLAAEGVVRMAIQRARRVASR